MAIEKNTSILSAVNVQERNYIQWKPSFSNNHVVTWYIIDWLHVLKELVRSINTGKRMGIKVSQFFVIEKTTIIRKIETFGKSDKSFLKQMKGVYHQSRPIAGYALHFWFDRLLIKLINDTLKFTEHKIISGNLETYSQSVLESVPFD